MSKKLTLNIDEKIVEFAHKYAKSTHQSVSSIFERFLADLKGKEDLGQLPDITRRLYGSLANLDIPDKKILRKKFYEKSIN